MIFVIGDVQGCCDALDRLLAQTGFSPSRDRLYVLGDLVNRGPKSLQVLRRLRALGSAATCLLGNHDLHLLAVAHGVRKAHRSDTLKEVLQARDRDAWIDWVRTRPMAAFAEGWLMVHAGVAPQWDAERTLVLAAEVERQLRGPDLRASLEVMYGNEPARWSESLAATERWRFVVNVLTRIRFCGADGTMDFKAKGSADQAPAGLMPWFRVPGRRTQGTPIAFGHWSTLGLVTQPDLLAIDTGCVWGGALTAVRIDGGRREVMQVACEEASERD
jgi:bis(5'-nucleosyl)-tetraphosphatase (symmetrical)